MTVKLFLNEDNILVDAVSQSKAAVLLNMSKLLSQCYPELNAQSLFKTYWEREHLGSTTIGHGLMIPHIRLQPIHKTYSCFMKLQHPVDFGAEDKQPIDLVFGLVFAFDNTKEHLTTLSTIVKQCSDPQFGLQCREALDHQNLCAVINQRFTSS